MCSSDLCVFGSIIFHPQLLDPSFPRLTSSARAAKLPLQHFSVSDETLKLSTSIADKLGKDRKLTSQERQPCFDNNLCMFCGGPGHSAKDCPKSWSSASKAKARHWHYGLKINLEEGTSPLIILMYPLSQSELKVLHNFLNDHL